MTREILLKGYAAFTEEFG